MSTRTCDACTTAYAPDLDRCPHCGSTESVEEGRAVKRLPLFVSVECAVCGRGPWQLRLALRMTGLVELPALFCASCGGRVQIPWPPVEDDMPKITVNGGATNALDEESSPDSLVSAPLTGAEAGQGHPTEVTGEVTGDGTGEALPELAPEANAEDAVELKSEPDPSDHDGDGSNDYEGMTVAELRELAAKRGVPSYGTKAQITERLREADGA
jgi:hypothetical protein